MPKVLKRILITLSVFIGVILLIILIYGLYVVIASKRIKDNQTLDVTNNSTEVVKLNEEYTITSFNIGYGAYTQDYTFFMDGGKESKARSADSVKELVNGASNFVKEYNPDFLLFQEVDINATRSYHINEYDLLASNLEGYSKTMAIDYDSAYLLYPLFKPIGKSLSSMCEFSKFQMASSLRKSLPISNRFSDIDRCYTVTRYQIDGGKELVIYNVQLSKYGKTEKVKLSQLELLLTDMKAEYDKGNYCICGGDFNYDFTGTSLNDLNDIKRTNISWAQPFPEELLANYSGIARALYYKFGLFQPTTRNNDAPYKAGNFTIITDGFLVSSNVEVTFLENVVTDFIYSDHNPVVMKFIMK